METINEVVATLHRQYSGYQDTNIRWASLLEKLRELDDRYEFKYDTPNKYHGDNGYGRIIGIHYMILEQEPTQTEKSRNFDYMSIVTTRTYWSNSERTNKTVICMRAQGMYSSNNSFRTNLPDTDRKLTNMADKIHKTTTSWTTHVLKEAKDRSLSEKTKNINLTIMAEDLNIPEEKLSFPRFSSSTKPSISYNTGVDITYESPGRYSVSVKIGSLPVDLVLSLRRAVTNIYRTNQNRKRHVLAMEKAENAVAKKLTMVRLKEK